MSIIEHDEAMENVNMAYGTDTSVETIVKDIISLADDLETAEESHEAWSKIQGALGYLSAKDTMLKFKGKMDE
jgi:hypothetical protein